MEIKIISQPFWKFSLKRCRLIGSSDKFFLPMIKWRQLTSILLVLLSIHFSTIQAQTLDTKVTFELKSKSLDKGLQLLGHLSKYKIAYSVQEVSRYDNIIIDKGQRTVKTTLELLLLNTNLTYKVKDKTLLIISKSAAQNSVAGNSYNASMKQISGIVTDVENQTLPGVSIRVKGSNKSAITAIDGKYRIEVGAADVLVFSFIGYETQEELVGAKSVHNVQLALNTKALDEVQVIGYGKTSKRLNTGSVSSITANELSKQTVSNPLTALQGKMAGMQITQNNGLPGAAVKVNIRGAYSGLSSAGYIPLYVIDGVPFTLFNGGSPASDNLNAFGISGANGGISPFSLINPEDIERIDVLKDADATAIYGARGSNGVVQITTKQGSQGKTTYNVNVSQGIAKVGHYIPMMNTDEYLTMRKEAFAYTGVTPTTTNAKDLTVWDQNAYTDWQKWAIGGTSHITNASASVSGGNAQTKFLYSSTFRKEGSVFQGDYNSTTFSNRVNVGHQSKDGKFSINLSANYTYMQNNLPSVDLSSLFNLPPNYSLYNSDGTLNWTLTNPLSYLKKEYKATTTNLITNILLSYQLMPNLKLKANLGYSLTSLNQTVTNPASSQNPASTTVSTLNYADNKNENYIVEPQMEYIKKISQGKLQVLLGSTFQQNKSTGISMTGTGYSNEKLINSLTAASSVAVSYNNNSLYKYTSVFGRVNYDWLNKYIIDGTIRRDGSSRFGSSHRFGNFGALGAAWIFTKEDFFANQNILSFGKFRGSYGLTGNDQIPDYQYSALYTAGSSSYSYAGSSIFYPSNIANPDLHWETSKKLDFALELGFIQDRIILKTDFYRNRSSDLLTYITIPSQSGTSSYSGNLPAVVQNKGWEFELNTVNIATGAFRWTTSFNLTINRNKLLSYPGLATSSYSSTYAVGEPTDIPKLYHFTGIDTKTGQPTFQDQNNDGQISSAADRVFAKAGHPYYGGLSNSLTYKNLQLDFAFQFNHRMGYVNNTIGVYPYTNALGYTYANQSTDMLNRWHQAGDIALYPSASTTNTTAYSNYIYYSDSNWGDASYIKLKTVSLNYTLPKSWTSSAKLASAVIYLQGQNLFTWAKQKYTYDPETNVSGADPGLGTGRYISFPQLRTIIIGLNVTL